MDKLKQNDNDDTYNYVYLNQLTLSTLINAVGMLFKLWLTMKCSQKVMMGNHFNKKAIRMDGEWRY